MNRYIIQPHCSTRMQDAGLVRRKLNGEPDTADLKVLGSSLSRLVTAFTTVSGLAWQHEDAVFVQEGTRSGPLVRLIHVQLRE